MNAKQRSRLEKMFDRISRGDDYSPQGFVLGVDVSHPTYGVGKVIGVKKNNCTVKLHANPVQLIVPIKHLLNPTHQWGLDHDELSLSKESYEDEFLLVKEKCKVVSDVRQSIMKEIFAYERGAVPDYRVSVEQLVSLHAKSKRNKKGAPTQEVKVKVLKMN